jgi:hypothetical protein
MTALLHFDKLFQIPLLLAHSISGIAYRDMIEAFVAADAQKYPTIAGIVAFFDSEARSIQQGGPEYVFSKNYLGIYWPADEYVFIKLTAERNFEAFYREAGRLLLTLLRARNQGSPLVAVEEAVALNGALVRQPFVHNDVTLRLTYDLLRFWTDMRNGETATLVERPHTVTVDRSSQPYDDFQAWCREVVWWGNKKGAYLYANRVDTMEKELAGHY